jgi:hypothetical protein
VDAGATDEDDSDDDLDDVEKAARRTLHGQRNIPKTSGRTEGPDVDGYLRLIAIARTLGPTHRRMLLMPAEELRKEGE